MCGSPKLTLQRKIELPAKDAFVRTHTTQR
jgi:hypothetical protein